MLVLEIVVVLVVLFVVGVVAAGGGGELRPFTPDRPALDLPEGAAMTGDDVRDTRFTLAFRGYRMEEVDALTERLAGEIEDRDEQLARLAGSQHTVTAAPPSPPEPEAAPENPWPSSS